MTARECFNKLDFLVVQFHMNLSKGELIRVPWNDTVDQMPSSSGYYIKDVVQEWTVVRPEYSVTFSQDLTAFYIKRK